MARTDTTLSEYEIQRQEKIAKNQALLRELQLNAASAGLAPNSAKPSRPKTNSSKPKRKPVVKVKEDVGPRRTSSRLRGIVADSEVAKRKAEEEHEAIREADRVKRQRVSEDLKLGDITVGGANWDPNGNWLRNFGPPEPHERTFSAEESIKKTTNKDIKELREKMSGLELWEGFEPNRLKATPERIYTMAFHPTSEKAVIFAGDKLGNLGVFDSSQSTSEKLKSEDDEDDADDDVGPAISTFKQHTRTITSILSIPSQPSAIYTSSYDSSIRRLDLEKGVSVEVWAPPSKDADEPVSGVQIPESDPHMLYFASLNGAFGMYDTRTDRSKATNTRFMQLSEKKIGGFSLHPAHSYLVATASLDRTLKIWDLRQITGKGNAAMPRLIGEHVNKLSVSHAAFNAIGQIATTSYDDTIKLYDLAPHMPEPAKGWPANKTLAATDMIPAKTVPHNNQTGRWVTIFKPAWQAHPTAVGGGAQRFVVGNMNRFVDVYAGSGEQLAQLGAEGVTAVPAVACFHPSMDWIAGGTASGKLCLWM